ncbi:hypothetical protein [Bryobacter aggregatus]|uniref:hypothetical protein n=1 Tax=Bryobacter aggregatus TaxID=360054 RepID=UPI000691717B|nr:hypothetical protein [Bryobacter aggregatus]
MSAAPEEFPFDFSSLQRGRFRYFPVAPGRMEFAMEVRRALLRERPPIVAIELPSFFAQKLHEGAARLPEISALVYPDRLSEKDDSGSAIYFVIEPCDAFVEAYRTAYEIGAEILLIDPAVGERPHLPDDYPDTLAIQKIGLERYIESYRLFPQSRNDEVTDFASSIAWKLQGADPLRDVFVVVSLNMLDPLLDAMELPQEPPRQRMPIEFVELVNVHPDSLGEVLVEYAALQQRYEYWRKQMSDVRLVDRPVAQYETFRAAEVDYEKNTGDKVLPYQRKLIAKFTRNLAHVSGALVATLYEMTIAARAIVDDNYAWELWQVGSRYGFQRQTSTPETLRLSGDEVFFRTRKLKLRRRLPRPKQRLKPRGLKEHRKEDKPGEWARQLNGNSICSYPPEDLVIEDFGRMLKKKAHSILTEERSRIEPFQSSLLDGIDLRETLRNWHQKTIYVRKLERAAGDVNSIVVIFDEDSDGRYGYLTTWLGEHQNESDMAFYSTEPFAHLVGPGIGRAEYGGYMMTLPSRRLWDVWNDPDYDFTESKAERLLMAALDYSTSRYVVYVAPKPPRSIFRSISNQLRRQILYIPLGQMSPTRIRKLRVVHVLDGYERRDTAKDYIW